MEACSTFGLLLQTAFVVFASGWHGMVFSQFPVFSLKSKYSHLALRCRVTAKSRSSLPPLHHDGVIRECFTYLLTIITL